MRSDYFTLGELTGVLHIEYARMRDIMINTESFPKLKMSRAWIIPKTKFFTWYMELFREGRVEEVFKRSTPNHEELMAAYNEYICTKMRNRIYQ